MNSEPTKEQIDAHVNGIIEKVATDFKEKYDIGQKEHGGKLWEKNVGPELYKEFLDFMAYLPTYMAQVDKLVSASQKAMVMLEGYPQIQEYVKEALAPFFYDMSKKGDD